jgi:hypothetical protein
MSIVKKLSLSVIAFLIYIIVPTLILLSVLHSAFFEEKIISNSMERIGLFQQTSERLIDDYSVTKEDIVDENSDSYAQAKEQIDAKAEQYANTINNILEETVTTNWVKQKFIGVENDLLLAIKGEQDFNFTINIADLKSTILTKFDASFTDEEQSTKVHQEVRATLTDLPTELDAQETGIKLNSLDSFQNYYLQYEQNNFWISGAMVLLFILGALIAYNSGGLFRWMGTTITSTGISITFYFVVLKYFPTIVSNLSLPIPSAASLSSEKIATLFTYLTSTLASHLMPYAIITVLLGLTLLALSYVSALNQKKIDGNKAA